MKGAAQDRPCGGISQRVPRHMWGLTYRLSGPRWWWGGSVRSEACSLGGGVLGGEAQSSTAGGCLGVSTGIKI